MTTGHHATDVEVHTGIDEHLPPSVTEGIFLDHMLSVQSVGTFATQMPEVLRHPLHGSQ
jgi:hypothetical protein